MMANHCTALAKKATGTSHTTQKYTRPCSTNQFLSAVVITLGIFILWLLLFGLGGFQLLHDSRVERCPREPAAETAPPSLLMGLLLLVLTFVDLGQVLKAFGHAAAASATKNLQAVALGDGVGRRRGKAVAAGRRCSRGRAADGTPSAVASRGVNAVVLLHDGHHERHRPGFVRLPARQ